MAKLNVMGDTIQITSDVTREEMERVERYAPEALKLFDDEGNEVFGVGIGNASFSKYGVCFCSETTEGKLFMTTNNPVLDHSDVEAERKEIVKHFAPMLSKLQAVEAHVAETAAALDEVEAGVEEAITFVG